MSARGTRGDDSGIGPIDRGRWSKPGRDVRERVRRLPRAEMLDAADSESTTTFRPDDVRAAGHALSEGTEVVVTRAYAQGECTVSIDPPDETGTWRVSGRVWWNDDESASITLALVHDDHVLATTAAASGAYFELEEVLPAGWTLEIHLPDRTCLRVDDPRA